MFNKLERRKSGFWSPMTIILSLVIHVALGAAAYAANLGGVQEAIKNEELVDFVDIEEEQQPEEPEVEEEEPPPPPPEPEPVEAPPVVKGFQELIPPQEPPARIPDVDPNQVAVKAEDFSGVGKAGGVAQGVETGVAQDVSERQAPPDEGTYEVSAVEELPELTNRQEVGRQLQRQYPPLLRDAGIQGSATMRLRVNEDGRVDPESITVENATHEAFGDAARRVVERMRFRPAKVGGRAVRVWVTLPVTFQLGS